MKESEYNIIASEFQFLTKRFQYGIASYDGFYKCYNPKTYGVRDEALDFLSKFQGYTLRHIYTPEHIQSHPYSSAFIDSELVVIKEHAICIHQELASILFHVLAFKLQEGISSLLELLEQIRNKHPKYLTINQNESIYSMKMFRYDELIADFHNLPDHNYVVDLFNRKHQDIIVVNLQNEIDFKIYKIKRILDRFKDYNFENLPI